ncbi:MAG: isopeptide-forming domain-containing fimbrial protein [Clostridia bacterium]|nr:isopeptide-forming domain-containing fimbrial protein [Clostridia bacterium]
MKQSILPENRRSLKKRGARAPLVLLLAAVLLLSLLPGALAEEAISLNALLGKAPELYSHWSEQLSRPWALKPGMAYTLRLTFEETAENAFARDGQPMVYRLPEGMIPVSDGQEHAFSVWAGSVLARALYALDAQERTVTVRWDAESPYYARLISAQGRQFTVDVPVLYLGGESLDFGGGYHVGVSLALYQKMAFGDGLPADDGLLAQGEYNGRAVKNYIPRELHVSIFGVVPQGSTVREQLDVPGARIEPDSFFVERVSRDENGGETRQTLSLSECGITVQRITDVSFQFTLPAMTDQQELVIHYYAVPEEGGKAAESEAASDFLVTAAWGESSTLLHESLHNAVVYARFDAEAGQENPVFTVRKIDREGKPLAGAAYRLEEKLDDGSLCLIAQDESRTDGVTFAYESLAPGEYLLTETAAPEGYVLAAPQEFSVTQEHTVLWWGTPEAFRYAMYTLTGVLPEGEVIWITHKEVGMLEEPGIAIPPTLNVKTDDDNDSDPAQDPVVWTDSSDHDLGDAVPFRLEAKLSNSVSSCRQYQITFADTMEAGLTNLKDYTVTIVRGGVETQADASFWQVIGQDDHSFRIKVELGDGVALLPHDLNGALVRVYFSAALNENLTVGGQGNVNAARLEYSVYPEESAEETGAPVQTAHTGDYKAIVYSYQFRFGKADQDGQPLSGASFTLEKVIAPRQEGREETFKEMPLDALSSTDTDFVFTGLDDGEYILTETRAPAGYLGAEPLRFVIRADHAAAWDNKEETRAETLLDLQAETEYGDVALTADKAVGLILGEDVVNVKAAEFSLKTLDVNDSLEAPQDAAWADTADYDIGDSVPFRIRIALPPNVSAFSAFRMTVNAALPAGLTSNKDYQVTLPGEDAASFTVEDADEGAFALAFAFGDGTQALPEALNGAEILIDFTAVLNSQAILGGSGNACAASITYAGGADGEITLGPDTAVIYTYGLTLKKLDEAGAALPGAAFKLEKKLADGTRKAMPLNETQSTDSVFVFPGLDDGVYLLTETSAPEGCLPAAPIEFTLTAAHSALLAEEADAPLLSLGIETQPDLLDAQADLETGLIVSSLMNVKERALLLQVGDINDSTEAELTWQQTADHDIGDSVPFRASTALPGNIASYRQYRFTFLHTMDAGLTGNRDWAVTVGGEPYAGFTVQETAAGFEVTVAWDGGGETLPASLANQEVVLTFTATLGDQAVLGEKGNACALTLRYPMNPADETEAETAPSRCTVYTYGLTVSKTDEGGAPLSGAAFRLEKKLLDGTTAFIPVTNARSTVSSFVFLGLDDGEYLLTETRTPAGYVTAEPIAFTLRADHAAALDALGASLTAGDTALSVSRQDGMAVGTVANVPAPTLSHKVIDKNDSTAARDTALWVDTADYDVGDTVPLRVSATLVGNVSRCARYHVTFAGTLEEGLANNKDYQVFLNGRQITDYTVTDTDRGFDLTITWGDGETPLPEEMNNAEVIVYYTATLTSAARTGAQGNLSAVRMRYALNASGDLEGETDESRVLVFTYRLNVASVNVLGQPLSGAAFTLEKKLADGSLQPVDRSETLSTDTLAVFYGLDDGDYVLTQTQAPDGHIAASAMTFTIRGDHTAVWNGDLYTRAYMLTSLTAAKPAGDMQITANKAEGVLAAEVLNVENPLFEKKVDDLNDSANTEDAVVWADSADYDIGDNVRFLLRTKLPVNFASYPKFHLTFADTMEEGLTNNKDYRVTVNGREFSGFTVQKEDEHSFEITLAWSGDAITEQLSGAEVLVQYTAQLNERAWVGDEGNVNTAVMRYSNSPEEETEAETEKQRAVVFTYRFTVTKANESGKPLEGAAFKLEKILANGDKKQIPLDVNTSTETAFSFRGLDDGRYLLTETKAPSGYVLSTPVEFTISATHDAEWNNNLYTRSLVLTGLSAETDSTAVTIRCDSETMNLRTTIINERSSDAPANDQKGYRNRFYFTKEWLGDVEESIDFTLYNPNGSIRRKSFNKTKISETEYLYEAWFSDWSEFYVVETPVDGYKVRYENIGDHAGETDRCYNGGKIINYKVPKTGDETSIGLWIGLTALAFAGLAALGVTARKRRRQNG